MASAMALAMVMETPTTTTMTTTASAIPHKYDTKHNFEFRLWIWIKNNKKKHNSERMKSGGCECGWGSDLCENQHFIIHFIRMVRHIQPMKYSQLNSLLQLFHSFSFLFACYLTPGEKKTFGFIWRTFFSGFVFFSQGVCVCVCVPFQKDHYVCLLYSFHISAFHHIYHQTCTHQTSCHTRYHITPNNITFIWYVFK